MNLSEINTYESAVSYCLAVPRFTKKNDMESTRDFYNFLGKPGSKARIVHVAGTNGKGSVCAFLQSICMQLGKKTGMFTSPHLCDIRERIRFDSFMISQEEFLCAFLRFKENLSVFREQHPNKQDYHPSYFELLFFIGMLYFEKSMPDIILLETGLGGRLDATNIIEKPAVCVITKIGFDHMEYLGDTLTQIAGEKAGILKKEVPVVYWKEKKEAAKVIEEKAVSLSSPCIIVSKEDVNSNLFHDKYIDFSYKSRYYGYVRFLIETKAVYQMENAALAIAAAEQLFLEEYELENINAAKMSVDFSMSEHKRNPDKEEFRTFQSLGEEVNSKNLSSYGDFQKRVIFLKKLQEGIKNMHWAGRMEEVLPGVFLDGAHNEDGIEAFLATVKQDRCRGKRSLLFSVVSDKQYQKMAKMIVESGLFDCIYTAEIASERSITEEELVILFRGAEKIKHFTTPEEALQGMICDRDEDDYLYAAGSLYLIGQLKEWLNRKAKVY